MWPFQNPTIRETNRYLQKAVDELLKKHGSVSNEDFERDLVAITGIAYKQVKNYKNHPKPGQRLKDNSLVVKYVRECRRRDKTGRFIRVGLVFAVVIGVIGSAYHYLTKPKAVEQFVLHEVPPATAHKVEVVETKVFIEIPSRDWLFRVGPLKQSKIPIDKFTCAKMPTIGLTNCSFTATDADGIFQAMVLLDGEMVRKFTVMSFAKDDIKAIRAQLTARVDKSLEHKASSAEPLSQLQFKIGNETVQVSSSEASPNSRAMITVSVSL